MHFVRASWTWFRVVSDFMLPAVPTLVPQVGDYLVHGLLRRDVEGDQLGPPTLLARELGDDLSNLV